MRSYYFLLSLLSTAVIADHPVSSEVSILYEYSPPFSYISEGRARGIYVEEMSLLFKQANISVTHEVYPFIRALKELKAHPNSLLFSLAKNQQREPQFIWLGILDSLCPALLKLAHRSDIQLKHKSEVKKYRIALVRKDFLSDQLQQQNWLDNSKVLWVADQQKAFQLFANNKVDLMAGDPFHVQLIFNHFRQQQIAFTKALELTQYQRQLYLAANTNIPSDMQQKLRQAIAQRSLVIRQQPDSKLRLSCNN